MDRNKQVGPMLIRQASALPERDEDIPLSRQDDTVSRQITSEQRAQLLGHTQDHHFFLQTALANGVLDSLARHLRPEEFAGEAVPDLTG